MWNELGAVLERQVAVASDATRRAAIYVKLGVLYTEKVQNVAQATTAWQALLQRGAGQPARAGRAQEALSPAEGLGRARGVLRRAGEVGRVRARARAPGGVRGRRRARRPLEQDRRALPRSPAEGRSRAEGVREGAVARRQEPAGRRGADPALREGQGRQAPRRGAVRRARTHDGSGGAAGASQAARRAARSGRGRQGRRAARGAAPRSPRRPPTSWAIETSRRLAAEGRGWAELVEAYEAALPRAAKANDETALLALLGTLAARVRIGARQPRAGHRAQSADPRARSPRTPRRWGRSSGSTSPPGASPICSPSTTRSWSWPRARTRSSRSASSWPASTRTRSSSPTRRCSSISRSSSRIPSRRRRWRRSIASTSSSDAGRSWRRRSTRRSISPPTWPRSPS